MAEHREETLPPPRVQHGEPEPESGFPWQRTSSRAVFGEATELIKGHSDSVNTKFRNLEKWKLVDLVIDLSRTEQKVCPQWRIVPGSSHSGDEWSEHDSVTEDKASECETALEDPSRLYQMDPGDSDVGPVRECHTVPGSSAKDTVVPERQTVKEPAFERPKGKSTARATYRVESTSRLRNVNRCAMYKTMLIWTEPAKIIMHTGIVIVLIASLRMEALRKATKTIDYYLTRARPAQRNRGRRMCNPTLHLQVARSLCRRLSQARVLIRLG